LIGMGLRSFSMHPSRILEVKQAVLQCHATKLRDWVVQVLQAEDIEAAMATQL
jgi:phosphotransferase system enzyme I (PtsI)